MATKNERVEAIVSLVRGSAVLHVGCVGGAVPRTAAEEDHCLHSRLCGTFGRADVLGIDINTTGVQQMKDRGFNVLWGNAENMDLDGHAFDTIVAGELIEHLANPGRFLDGCLRHLKSSGRVVVSTPNSFSVMSYLMYLKNYPRYANREHAMSFCAQTLTQLSQRSGLQVSEIQFVDDLRPDIVSSRWYRSFCLLYRLLRAFLPKRLRNTIVAVLKPG